MSTSSKEDLEMLADIEFRQVTKSYHGISAVSDISISVYSGDVLGLIGPNGSGKTTLVNIATGFTRPDSGAVLFRGTNIASLPPHRISNLGIGRTFQSPRVIARFSVIDHILLAISPPPRTVTQHLKYMLFPRIDSIQADHAASYLEWVDLVNESGSLARSLSYGQKKLLNLACCMAKEPRVLLLDEPTSGISPTLYQGIGDVLQRISRRANMSIVIIDHNLQFVSEVCNRFVFLDSGQLVAAGSISELQNSREVRNAYFS